MHWLHGAMQRPTCTETAPSQKKKLSLTFPLFHGNSRHCIPEVHVGCSLNKGSVLERPQLKIVFDSLSSLYSLSVVFFFSSFFLILSLFCLSRHGPSQTHTHTSYLPLMLLQAHTPTSRITRVSVQALLLSHKAPTVPWSTGLLRYTWPLHTYTHTLTYTHRAHRAVKTA